MESSMAEQEPLPGVISSWPRRWPTLSFSSKSYQTYEAGENKEMTQLMQAELDKRASPDQQERLFGRVCLRARSSLVKI